MAWPNADLVSLLPSAPYVLAYSLPLLFSSILLTFCGAFLTLDRTRSFPPQYNKIAGGLDSRAERKRFRFLLEGGIGGLATGYTLGVHLSTFLALLIPNNSLSPPLAHQAFLPVWLLSAVVTTSLAGRWRYCALAFSGLSGGATLSLALSIILHPLLLSRLVLTSVFIPILTVLTLLPLTRVQHIALRFATACTGAFGIVLSIALLAHIPSWANVWERLWLPSSRTWGTAEERGLSAGWCFLVCAGTACDWFLRRKFGENTDEIWDHYLANYAAELPHASDRAGTFRPLTSLWDRFFRTQETVVPLAESIRFPPDEDLKSWSDASMKEQSRSLHTPLQDSKGPASLNGVESRPIAKLKVRAASGRRREGAKFRPLDDDSSSDSDYDSKSPLTPDSVRPWLQTRPYLESAASGSVTLHDVEALSMDTGRKHDPEAKGSKADRVKVSHLRGGSMDYSDYEEDVTAHAQRIKRRVSREKPGWSPEFLRRGRSGTKGTGVDPDTASQRAATTPLGPVPVPATPSLIRAMDRIAAAQKEAFAKGEDTEKGVGLPPAVSPDGPEGESNEAVNKESKARWQGFWREVKTKAR